jgi:hypothetical protein
MKMDKDDRMQFRPLHGRVVVKRIAPRRLNIRHASIAPTVRMRLNEIKQLDECRPRSLPLKTAPNLS